MDFRQSPASPASSATLSIHSSQDGESSVEDLSPEKEYADHKNHLLWNNGQSTTFEFSCVDCDDFNLPKEYLLVSGTCGLSSSILAASNPDPRILHKVLYHGYSLLKRESSKYLEYFRDSLAPNLGIDDWLGDLSSEFSHNSIRTVDGISTPLLVAIRSRLPTNVRILLAAGADPNGAPVEFLADYAACFLRFRNRIPSRGNLEEDPASLEDFLRLMDYEQLSPLLSEEIENQSSGGAAPFWCNKDFAPADLYPYGWQSHSLVAAAYSGSTEILNHLIIFGANASHWVGDLDSGYSCRTDLPSSLATSTPLHAAILGSNMNMLRHLLDLQFNPNVLATSDPIGCYTPLMATIISQSTFNKEAFDILISHPKINIYLRTPVYNVHVLHLAVARLELDVLINVSAQIPLYTAGVTALGQNLLHIACLPTNAKHIQHYSEDIHLSIHKARNLSSLNPYLPRSPPEVAAEDYTIQFNAQINMVKWLLASGMSGKLGAQDIHGNTPFHYLASYVVVNTKLVDWLKTLPGGMAIWKESENSKGATPEMLMQGG